MIKITNTRTTVTLISLVIIEMINPINLKIIHTNPIMKKLEKALINQEGYMEQMTPMDSKPI